MVAEVSEDMRFDFVLLSLLIIAGASAAAVTPRPLEHPAFAQEIGALRGVGLVGRPEDHSIAEIQGQHPGLVIAQRRDERRARLRSGDNGGSSLSNHVHTVVIARSILTGRHESLRFVRPKDEQIVVCPFGH